MLFPITASWTKSVSSGSVSLVLTITDNSGSTLTTIENVWPVNATAYQISNWIRNTTADYVMSQMAASDIPDAGSIKYGWPDTIRPVEML